MRISLVSKFAIFCVKNLMSPFLVGEHFARNLENKLIKNFICLKHFDLKFDWTSILIEI